MDSPGGVSLRRKFNSAAHCLNVSPDQLVSLKFNVRTYIHMRNTDT